MKHQVDALAGLATWVLVTLCLRAYFIHSTLSLIISPVLEREDKVIVVMVTQRQHARLRDVPAGQALVISNVMGKRTVQRYKAGTPDGPILLVRNQADKKSQLTKQHQNTEHRTQHPCAKIARYGRRPPAATATMPATQLHALQPTANSKTEPIQTMRAW